MKIENFESKSLDVGAVNLSSKFSELHNAFKNSVKPESNAFMKVPDNFEDNIASWIGLGAAEGASDLAAIRPEAVDTIKQMYYGTDLGNGKSTTGLKDIHHWKVNKNYKQQNLKQHAGYAAEIIGTAKENIQAQKEGLDYKVYRADDRPDKFPKNDQHVDKFITDANDNIIERIQVKFVGKNGRQCFSKLASKSYDKYFEDGKVDSIEIPSDYYEEIKKLIPDKINGYTKQLNHLLETGNIEKAQKIQAKIDRCHLIDQKLRKSTVSSEEAMLGTKHPTRYISKMFSDSRLPETYKESIESTALSAGITAAISTVDNVSRVMDGEITPEEAFVDTAAKVGTSGGISFISTTTSRAMLKSSHQLIKSLGHSGISAAAIAFGVESFDSVVDYADGTISGKQLALDLGENSAETAGGFAGGAAAAALTGAALGSVVPGAGTAAGAAAGFASSMVGSMIGCAVASEAYNSAVEIGAENAGVLADKAHEMADRTIEIASKSEPKHVDHLTAAINEFADENNLPFRV